MIFHQQHWRHSRHLMSLWLLQIWELRLSICVSKVPDCESKYRTPNWCCLRLEEGRMSYYQAILGAIYTSAYTLQPLSPVNGVHLKIHCYVPWRKLSLWLLNIHGSMKVLARGSLELLPDWPPNSDASSVLLPLLPQTALAPNAERLRPWLVATLPWFAKSPSQLESHLSIKKYLSNHRSEERARQQSIWHSKSNLDGFKHHYPFFPASLFYPLQVNKVLLWVLQGVNPPRV